MEDRGIIALFFDRSEQAIVETDRKYGPLCYSVAYNVLNDREDARECVNDTYLAAWNAIPPQRPNVLSAFLSGLARRISIDRWRGRSAKKRGGGELVLALEELDQCAGGGDLETALERQELRRALERFLSGLSETERHVFVCRYWYLDSIAAIAQAGGFSQSKVHSMLHRLRGRLRKALEKEGLL